MKTFLEWLKAEALESDIFDPHDDDGAPPGGSSHSVRKLKHRTGGGTYWSKSANSDLQTINEYIAWKIYKLFGVRVADQAHLVVDKNNVLRLAASQVSGKQLPGYDNPADHLSGSDVHTGFFVDAFLGNWDVVGNEPRFNLFVDDQKKVSRIDLGGMDFRAMGQRKSSTIPGSWGDQVGELQTMAGIGGSPLSGHSANVFGGLQNDREKLEQAAAVFKQVHWEQIEQQLDVVKKEVDDLVQEHELSPSVSHETQQYIDQIRGVLKSRFADMHNKLKSLNL